jgi:dipeptidyl aminopeptidase/acylaminoacyl peptidase
MKLSDRFDALDATRSPDLWRSIENREPRPSPPTMPVGRRATVATLALVIAASGIAVAIRAFQRSVVQMPASTASNGLIAYVETDDPGDGPWRIVTIEPDGSGRHVLTAEPGRYAEPASSPDGSRLALTVTLRTATSRIATMNADGTGLKELTYCSPPECLSDTSPTWSPDGSELAWARVSGAGAVIPESIFMAGEQRPATKPTLALPGLVSAGDLAWSPDGTSIAFDASKAGTKRFSIYEVDVNSGAVTQLTDCPITECSIGDLHPSWAPDGSGIVFARDGDLYVMNRNGSDVRQLYSCRPSCAGAMEPVWSPDGKGIAFAVQMAEQRDLYVMGWDGSDVRRLTETPGDEFSPTWEPIPVSTSPGTDGATPPTAHVTKIVDLPGPGAAVAYGEESVWVAASNGDGSDEGRVLRLDPVTGDVVADIAVPTVPTWEVGGGGLATGDGSVWVAGAMQGPRSSGSRSGESEAVLVRINAATDRVVSIIDLGGQSAADVAVDGNAAWVLIFADDRKLELIRVDPSTDRVAARIPVAASYGHYVFAHGGNVIVAANEVSGSTVGNSVLFLVDPSANEVIGKLGIRSMGWPAMDDDGIAWIATGDRLLTVNPATLDVYADVALRSTGDALAAGNGGIWFLDPSDRGAVHRYNTATGEVDVSANLPNEASTPVAMALSPDAVWVLDYDLKIVRIGLS